MAAGLIVAAPASGAGKTMVTLGLLRALRDAGVAVRSAKIGPDYIDPGFHRAATGRASVNLDGWAMRPALIDALVAEAAAGARLILAEGVMGLFDGAPRPGAGDAGSTAEMAARLGWPVLLVIDAARQAQSVAALAQGFRDHRADVRIAGVVLNRVAGPRHEAMLREALAAVAMPVFGALPRRAALTLPSRHLGLVQAMELDRLETVIGAAAALVADHLDLAAVLAAGREVPVRAGPVPPGRLPPPGQRVAVARDAAFSFLYPHLLRGWRAAGAELCFFSPLSDEGPPPGADGVVLPGGYPELHVGRLAANRGFLGGLRRAAEAGAMIHGECGGYMVLGRTLAGADGVRHPMAGLLPVCTSFARPRLTLGYRRLRSLSATPFGPAGTVLRGHEFHQAVITEAGPGPALFMAETGAGEAIGPVGHRRANIFGSFAHLIDLA